MDRQWLKPGTEQPPLNWSIPYARIEWGQRCLSSDTNQQTVIKLRQVEVIVGPGMLRLDAIREISITEQTDYR